MRWAVDPGQGEGEGQEGQGGEGEGQGWHSPMEVEPRGGVTGQEGIEGGEPGQEGNKGKREAGGLQEQRDMPCTQRLTQGRCGA